MFEYQLKMKAESFHANHFVFILANEKLQIKLP